MGTRIWNTEVQQCSLKHRWCSNPSVWVQTALDAAFPAFRVWTRRGGTRLESQHMGSGGRRNWSSRSSSVHSGLHETVSSKLEEGRRKGGKEKKEKELSHLSGSLPDSFNKLFCSLSQVLSPLYNRFFFYLFVPLSPNLIIEHSLCTTVFFSSHWEATHLQLSV